MKPKLLAIYNICGISGFQNVAYYVDAIKSILFQRGFEEGELKLCISSCLSLPVVEFQLKRDFGSLISYNWIDASYPLTVTFNHTVQKCVDTFGPFDGYLYLDSGISFHDCLHRFDALKVLWDKHQSGPYAITAAMPTNDDGRQWWEIEYPQDGSDYILPVGKATNLHCQIYSEEMRKIFGGRLHCDIFANDTSESVTTFLVAAMKKKMQVIQQVMPLHSQNMDGASIGWRGQNQDGTVRLFMTEKTMEERYHEGFEFGFGYEECKPRWLHDPEKFDEEGYARDPRLLDFLQKELFLKAEEFDYSEVPYRFEP